MDSLDAALSELEDRLERHPPERYPVQHATARFHQGIALMQAGRPSEAEVALSAAADLFAVELHPAEHGATMNALGALLRDTGRPSLAARAFERASSAFRIAERPLEQGAATFNLGLARLAEGDRDAAAASFRDAIERLDPDEAPAQAAAAHRELGALLLEGDPEAAVPLLERAVELALAGQDPVGRGAAANGLGLAYLALDRLEDALGAFGEAIAANPPSVRPEAHAMARGNAALVHERRGDRRRARLAAAQALATPEAPTPVRRQAQDLLARCGSPTGDLIELLDDAPLDEREIILRPELRRWRQVDEEARLDECVAWVEGQLAREGTGVELAEALLGQLLELPPDDLELVLTSLLSAVLQRPEEERSRFRSQWSRAMVRFPHPQWTRLRTIVNQLAARLGDDTEWT